MSRGRDALDLRNMTGAGWLMVFVSIGVTAVSGVYLRMWNASAPGETGFLFTLTRGMGS